jgi:hypothetical protein
VAVEFCCGGAPTPVLKQVESQAFPIFDVGFVCLFLSFFLSSFFLFLFYSSPGGYTVLVVMG